MPVAGGFFQSPYSPISRFHVFESRRAGIKWRAAGMVLQLSDVPVTLRAVAYCG